MALDNPFNVAREARSKTLTIRLTPTEYDAVKKIADEESVDLGDLVREGLGTVVEKRIATRSKGRR